MPRLRHYRFLTATPLPLNLSLNPYSIKRFMPVYEMAHSIAVSDSDKAEVPDYGIYLPNRYAAVIDQQLGAVLY
jgi:hypothetical protein